MRTLVQQRGSSGLACGTATSLPSIFSVISFFGSGSVCPLAMIESKLKRTHEWARVRACVRSCVRDHVCAWAWCVRVYVHVVFRRDRAKRSYPAGGATSDESSCVI